MTDDGYVRVTGRTKDIVIRGGMNISVREIEDNLADHPALHGVVVCGHARRAARRDGCAATWSPRPDIPLRPSRTCASSCWRAGMPIQKTPERVVAVDVPADDRDRQGPQTRVAQRHRTAHPGRGRANPGSFGCPLMELKDSPAEAEFRAKARGWLENTLPTPRRVPSRLCWRTSSTIGGRGSGCCTTPVTPACPGRRSTAVAARTRSCVRYSTRSSIGQARRNG